MNLVQNFAFTSDFVSTFERELFQFRDTPLEERRALPYLVYVIAQNGKSVEQYMFATLSTCRMQETPITQISRGGYLAVGLEKPYQSSQFYTFGQRGGVPFVEITELLV